MQIIKLGETTAAQIEIPFTTVSISNLQTRLTGAQLPNSSITVYIKKGGVGSAVAGGAGTFTTVDDTNAAGVRGYRPSTGELVQGISTFIFTGTNGGNTMEPREVPVMVINDDPYALVEGTVTPIQAMRLFMSMLAGAPVDTSGSSVIYKSTDGTKTRATLTYDATGRVSVTLGDLS